ncbi:MAG: hypothetical protein HY260_18245, partial [Chloroflexi bacterium]|nr:hypothetical protein [Chloroflexota bacterium]
VLLFVALACGTGGGGGAASPATEAAQTVGAILTASAAAPVAGAPTNPPAPTSSGGGAAPTSEPGQPTQPAAPPKPTDTAGPTNTPNPTGCSDNAAFVADVTVPDNTVFLPGTAFTKTWRLKNSGSCKWNGSYSLAFVADNAMGGPATVSIVGEVTPGSNYDVSANFVAPTTPGTYKGVLQMRNGSGAFFGTKPYIQIVVAAPTATNTVAPTATLTSTFAPSTATFTPSPTPPGSIAGDYAGNWYNNDPGTGGVTQIVVAAASSSQITAHAWGRCHPTDCDWGTGSGAIAGYSVTINNFPGAPGNIITLTLPSPGALHAVVTSSSTFNYDFHIGPIANDWVGTWTNTNAGTSNITKIVISSSGGQLTVHPYGKCTPQDCDWGSNTYAYANPLTASGMPHNIVLTFVRANELTVVDSTVGLTENFNR